MKGQDNYGINGILFKLFLSFHLEKWKKWLFKIEQIFFQIEFFFQSGPILFQFEHLKGTMKFQIRTIYWG